MTILSRSDSNMSPASVDTVTLHHTIGIGASHGIPMSGRGDPIDISGSISHCMRLHVLCNIDILPSDIIDPSQNVIPSIGAVSMLSNMIRSLCMRKNLVKITRHIKNKAKTLVDMRLIFLARCFSDGILLECYSTRYHTPRIVFIMSFHNLERRYDICTSRVHESR